MASVLRGCYFIIISPVDLLGLLNWRSNPENLEQILQRLMGVEGGEIVKVSPHVCCIKTHYSVSCLHFLHGV